MGKRKMHFSPFVAAVVGATRGKRTLKLRHNTARVASELLPLAPQVPIMCADNYCRASLAGRRAKMVERRNLNVFSVLDLARRTRRGGEGEILEDRRPLRDSMLLLLVQAVARNSLRPFA